MKLIIDINEEELTEDEIEEAKRIADDCFSGVKTIIPDNATNGDVAELVWGFKPRENTCIIPKTECNGNPAECDGCSFDDWWNAPYQKGGTNRKNCEYRHENGNCLKVGGFCTSVDDEHCVKGGK